MAFIADTDHQVSDGAANSDDVARLFELSTDLLAGIDRRGRLVCVNMAWERSLGWRRDALEGKPIFELVHPDDVERHEGWRRCSGRPLPEAEQVEIRLRGVDGGYRWFACSIRPGGDVS